MSEPVAWRVDMGEHGWYLFGNFQDARKHCADDEEPEPLYPADAIERKDAAIAELVQAGRAVVDRWDSPLWKDLPHTGEFIARLRAAIAKYDK